MDLEERTSINIIPLQAAFTRSCERIIYILNDLEVKKILQVTEGKA